MKRLPTLHQWAFALVMIFLCSGTTSAQPFPGLPLNPARSPLFGKDIIINDQPAQDQAAVDVCEAFNGWLYAACAFNMPEGSRLSILRSVDNGLSWIVELDDMYEQTDCIKKLGITTTGNDISNLKLIMAVQCIVPSGDSSWLRTHRLHGYPVYVEWNDMIIEYSWDIRDIAIASDNGHPALNSNPNSVGILYSRGPEYSFSRDSLVFHGSSNGGLSFGIHKSVASANDGYINRVALSYAYSPSYNTGRYFAAWEKFDSDSSATGHIFTSHTNPNFNSNFTPPFCVDSLSPELINSVRYPVISCQQSSYDNDSLNITALLLFEKKNFLTGKYSLQGCYNLQAATTNHFTPLTITDPSLNSIQPSACFNPYDSSFMVTYFDSGGVKLPLLKHNMNMNDANTWNIISQAYNDDPNLLSPSPRVKYNSLEHSGMNVWIAQRTSGKREALFDATYSAYTGVPGNKIQPDGLKLLVYPNPCNSFVNVNFELKKAGEIHLQLFNTLGQEELVIAEQRCREGKNTILIDTSSLKNGHYYLVLSSVDQSATEKVIVLK